ncbi:hypothetical protein B0H17DRAFT_868931, partial [Mycena rosella]
VQNHLVATIDGPRYHAKLPTMSDEAWDSISDDGSIFKAERRRLEWIGDSAMSARTSIKVYEMFPHGGVDFYTVVRSFVLSNETFSHIMQKIGPLCLACVAPFPAGKYPADLFETVVGAFYKEKRESGWEREFDEWFDDTFTPLIEAADAAF